MQRNCPPPPPLLTDDRRVKFRSGPDKLEVVASFCYLGDMLSAGGGCELAVTTCVKITSKKFRELLPVLTSYHLSYKTHNHAYSSCMQSAMLHASETWPLTKPNLQLNDRAMIRQIYSVKPENVATVKSRALLAKLELEDLVLILRERSLHWFGHVERSSGSVRTAFDIQFLIKWQNYSTTIICDSSWENTPHCKRSCKNQIGLQRLAGILKMYT